MPESIDAFSLSTSFEASQSDKNNIPPETPEANFINSESTMAQQRDRQEKIIIECLKQSDNNKSSSREMKAHAKIKYNEEWPYLMRYWDQNLSELANRTDAGFRRIEGSYNYELIVDEDEKAIISIDEDLPEKLETDGIPPVILESDYSMEDAKDIKKQEREKNLYPSLVSWLITKKYFSKDTSTFKKGGQWGNPDVTGIKIINDIFGLERLEVCTIEAKAAATDWKKYIFEAVSHKRFANRAYFAFAIGSDKPSIRDIVDYNEMRDYGEKFKIGIIAIFLQINDFKTLNSVRDLSLGDVDIIEVWPALYEEAKPDSSDKFCREFLGFKNRLDVYNFKSIFDD